MSEIQEGVSKPEVTVEEDTGQIGRLKTRLKSRIEAEHHQERVEVKNPLALPIPDKCPANLRDEIKKHNAHMELFEGNSVRDHGNPSS